jgi:hypothetical protein
MPNLSGALANQVSNVNLMSNLKFVFKIQRYPDVNYFVQRVNLPNVSFPTTPRPTPFTTIPMEGDHLLYEQLTVSFLVDENLKNWNNLYAWMTGITFPRSFSEFRELKTRNSTIRPDSGDIYSDISLTILSNKSNPISNVMFRNCFPNELTGISFDTTNTDVEPILSTVTFAYTWYDVELLG